MPEHAGASDRRREILRLAVPAFLTLVAEPLFLLADSAIVGHLGTPQLAGLGVAGAALATASSLFVFLAYGTTAVVARRIGAGDVRAAVAGGIDGLWLALGLGVVTGALAVAYAEPICRFFGVSPEATGYATTYLQISALGIPSMLLVLAATGVLRGLQDTRTPLVASVAGFTGNIALNVTLVYAAGMGIAGAAWGTVIAQTAMAVGLCLVVLDGARRHRASVRPQPGGIVRAALGGVPLLVRTLALRAAILLTAWVAASLGDVPLAAYQVSASVWTFLAFALDALAIAAQSLTGKALGAGDVAGVRSATALMVRWSMAAGVGLGLLTAALAPILPALFTPDPQVRSALVVALLVVALGQPLAAYAFVLDGVLIGAGDGRALAFLGVAAVVVYAPVILAVHAASAHLGEPRLAVAVLWGAFLVFMAARCVGLGWRAAGDAWLVTGSR